MKRTILFSSLALTLFAGCGTSHEGGDYGETDGLGFDDDAFIDGAGQVDETAPTHGEDEIVFPPPGEDPDGSITNPSGDDSNGRITWIGDVDGNLVVHATISDDVLALYPSADHYAMRFVEADAVLDISIVEGDDVVLDLFRVQTDVAGKLLPNQTVTRTCYPFPGLPPVSNCFPSDGEPWPGMDDMWPNCLEVGSGDDPVTSTEVVGAIEGVPFGQRVTIDDEVQPIYDATLTDGQAERLGQIQTVYADVLAIRPEITPLGLCWDCAMFGLYIANQGIACGQGNDAACKEADIGKGLFENNCDGACE